MTTFINIETSTYQLPRSFRWVLVLPCLLVFASGCRSAVTTQASVALNTYQTPQTLPAGSVGSSIIAPAVTSSLGAMLNSNKLKLIPAAMSGGGFDLQLGLGNGWDIGCMARLDANFFDASGSVRPYIKARFTENNAPFVAALLFGSEFIGGSFSNSSQIYVPQPFLFFPQPNLPLTDTTITTTVSRLSSSAFRVFASVPMIFAITKYNDVAFILHPGIHYWEQHINQSDTITSRRYGSIPTGAPNEITTKTISKEQISCYIIPSISLSMRGQNEKYSVQPEFTLAIAGENIIWNFGISFQFGKFGENSP